MVVVAKVEVPATTRRVPGVEVPIPTLPALVIWSLSLEAVLKITSPDPLASESEVMIASTVLERDAADPKDAEDIVEPSAKMICPPEPAERRMSPLTVKREVADVVPSASLPVVAS